ncbi:hypothetical protein [Paenibacillus nasutitermitis]|uniref:Transposase n=1 Tax=Paenibacillus nasutitermitis TaxID=1652958 RepID=A0A916ZJV5_9BACL|nr:hypothetical protein [Paenibacillus nasutitermitis]GGE01483.1 hypothetical protein GCM10010911_70470 [Paenibacillus nasutitermitis]
MERLLEWGHRIRCGKPAFGRCPELEAKWKWSANTMKAFPAAGVSRGLFSLKRPFSSDYGKINKPAIVEISLA